MTIYLVREKISQKKLKKRVNELWELYFSNIENNSFCYELDKKLSFLSRCIIKEKHKNYDETISSLYR